MQYGYSSKQQVQLEKKEDMKARGLASPDLGDCLAMSFSVTVQKQQRLEPLDPLEAHLEERIRLGFGQWI